MLLKRSILKPADGCFLTSLQLPVFGRSLAFLGLQPHNSNLLLCNYVAFSLWLSVFTQPSSFIMQLSYFQIRSHSGVPRVRTSTWLLENMIQSITRAQPENLFTPTILNNAKKKKKQWIRYQFKKHQPSMDHAAAAAAKLLQLCPTLFDPIDGSPPGSPVPGILQARTLEWVAISFSNA